jgi:AcrR family transcriptional regulator
MNISPGNLYYHFGNKDEIIGELFDAFEARVGLLLTPPPERKVEVEDLWLLLHLLFEAMWAYRFLYRDLDELTSRHHRLGMRFGALIERWSATMLEFCRSMAASGAMRASESEMAATARNIVLLTTYSLSFERLTHAPASRRASEVDLGVAAYHVLALIAPYLVDDARLLLQKLAREYL